ncbi:hypothetical protein RHECNPAF_1260022 [Rhizobium etli CNPAF512]|nr:hypothetical protein RHECNPAF_1260022 [Rhizobium etli CNPAF512]
MLRCEIFRVAARFRLKQRRSSGTIPAVSRSNDGIHVTGDQRWQKLGKSGSRNVHTPSGKKRAIRQGEIPFIGNRHGTSAKRSTALLPLPTARKPSPRPSAL